jgi:hypothetical protein
VALLLFLSFFLLNNSRGKKREASGSLVGALSRQEVNRCERASELADAYRLFIPVSMNSSSSLTTVEEKIFSSSIDDVALKNKLFFSFFLSFFHFLFQTTNQKSLRFVSL